MNLISLYKKYSNLTTNLQNIALLLLRFILAYGFYNPAMMKVKDIHAIGDWFKEMGMPFPYVNAYLATVTEIFGVILLALGLGTRIISVPLIVLMIVAIKTVHWVNGFDAGNNGFEIPLYYIFMLITLITFGAGKISIDYLIENKRKKSLFFS